MAASIEIVADLCRDFLKPFLPLLEDPEVTDIFRNSNGLVFVKSNGVQRQVVGCEIAEKDLEFAINAIGNMNSTGANTGRNQPILDTTLPGGTRVNAVLRPISQPGSSLSIRKFRMDEFTLDELVRRGSIEERAGEILRGAVLGRKSMLLSGPTGSGKTTLVNALLGIVDPSERLVLIEDTAELQVALPNVACFIERPAQQGVTAITLRMLVKNALRQCPDRIIVGESRGAEAFEFVTALTTGHDGSVSSIHGNSAGDALDRLVACCRMASDVNLPVDLIKSMVSKSLRYVVQLNQKREVIEIVTVAGIKDGEFVTPLVYQRVA